MRGAVLAVVFVSAALIASEASISVVDSVSSDRPEVRPLIKDVLASLLEEQYTETRPFKPFKWGTTAGLFPSYVKLNTHGNPGLKAFRDSLNIPDDNGFVTSFCAYALAETRSLAKDGAVDAAGLAAIEKALGAAVPALDAFRDQNRDAGVPVYGFWKQQKDETSGVYFSQPENLVGMLTSQGPLLKAMYALAKKAGLHKIEAFLNMVSIYLQVFRIPPDSDDTGVTLALGPTLAKADPSLKDVADHWWKQNSDLPAVFSAYVKYAYRPFGNVHSPDDGLVDPRTYFWIRKYLAEKQALGHTDIALVSTWMSNLEETKSYYQRARGNVMPGNANNFDASVGANALFGMTNVVLELHSQGKDVSFFNAEVQKVYSDTADILEWVLRTDALSDRPDLILLYYPPVYDFYWFVARLVQSLESAAATMDGGLPFDVMQKVMDLLSTAMRRYGTEQILAGLEREAGPSIAQPSCYWQQFLGMADTTWFGAAKPTHDDRLFTTAVAFNALMDTWARRDTASHQLSFDKSTPLSVREAIECTARYLANAVPSGELKFENAFFSGSLKGGNTMSSQYPMNRIEMFNGDRFECKKTYPHVNGTAIFELVFGVNGVMTEQEYNDQLFFNCFYMAPPMVDEGLNPKPSDMMPMPGFPYWSSPALTKALLVLGLTKYDNIHTPAASPAVEQAVPNSFI